MIYNVGQTNLIGHQDIQHACMITAKYIAGLNSKYNFHIEQQSLACLHVEALQSHMIKCKCMKLTTQQDSLGPKKVEGLGPFKGPIST